MIKDRIKELREKNNLSVVDFAKSLGVSTVSVRQYESGRQNPGKKTIQKICEVYGVEEEWLTGSTPTAEAANEETPVINTEAEKKEAPVAAKKEKKTGRKAKKADAPVIGEKKEEKKEPDIPAILARANEIGVRKAAVEAGVAWQTVNKWKKDAEKAATMSTPTEIEEDIAESIKERASA